MSDKEYPSSPLDDIASPSSPNDESPIHNRNGPPSNPDSPSGKSFKKYEIINREWFYGFSRFINHSITTV